MDLQSKLSEPRFCYKFLQKNGSNIEKKGSDPLAKQVVIDNNFNFLFDFIQNTLNPIQVLPIINKPANSSNLIQQIADKQNEMAVLQAQLS